MLDGLKTADLFTELLAHLGVLDSGLQRPPRHTHRLGRERDHRQILDHRGGQAHRTHRRAIQCDRGPGAREVGRLLDFDRDAGLGTVHQHPAVGSRGQQDAVSRTAQHGRQHARSQPVGNGQVPGQRQSRGALPARQRWDQFLVPVGGEHHRHQCAGGNRAGHQCGGGLVDHRDHVVESGTRSACGLRYGDTENAQFSQPYVRRTPSVRPGFHLPDRLDDRRTLGPLTDGIPRGFLDFG
ncbi:Uncharacterised protein [Mycobacteroides abscessus subsp. massiliense]|nr:Uncharacterised protein [Mycobacteroides abscessus subsp. massiliense]